MNKIPVWIRIIALLGVGFYFGRVVERRVQQVSQMPRQTEAELIARFERRQRPVSTLPSIPNQSLDSEWRRIDLDDDSRLGTTNHWMAHFTYLAAREANVREPERPYTSLVRVRRIQSDGQEEEMRLTLLEYQAFKNADELLLMYGHARRAMCRDPQGRRYLFGNFPTTPDRARGVRCYYFFGSQYESEIMPVLVSRFYPVNSSNVNHGELDAIQRGFDASERYPARCALSGDQVPPDCRSRNSLTSVY